MKKRSQNFIALRQLRDHAQICSLQDLDEDPSLFVFARLMELFAELDLPVETVGNIKVVIAPSFFESKKMANSIIHAFVVDCQKVYDIINDRVADQDKVIKIFGDYLGNNMRLCWMNQNYPPQEENN